MIGKLTGRLGKIAYGFGNLGQAVFFHTIGTYLIYFYIDVMYLDPALVGLGFLVSYGIWNSINDPIAGYISDRTRSRWGRRIPFILFCTPPTMLFFILIWLSPGWGMTWLLLYFMITLGIFELLYTFVTVGWNSLFPEMFQDLKERTEVSAYRQVAAFIGIIVNFILTPLIITFFIERFGTHIGWTLTASLLACIGGGAFLISLLGSRERKEFSMAGTLPIKTAFKITFSNKSFLTAAFSILMISWVWSLLSAMTPFVVIYMFGGTLADIPLISGPLIFITMLFYPLWRKICIRLGTKNTLTYATFSSVLILLPFFLIAKTVFEGALIMSFYGFTLSGVTLVREILIPDVIDEDEIKTGFRREGIYFGVGTFIDRFALALTGLSTTLIFGLTGFIPGVPQPPSVILGMRLMTTIIMILALVGFLIAIKLYPLGAQKVEEIRGTIEKLREAKMK
jgi:GPH family glycoside/pentoside/hexuronide:cation symporter